MDELIVFEHIYKIYEMGDTEVRAADDISFSIKKGEFVAIVGQSGSGKSTCMNIIGALDVPTDGDYYLGGEDVSTMNDNQLAKIRNEMLGFIFQQYNLIPKLTVLENVELPLLYAGVPKSKRRKQALESLERVGLSDKAKNLPSQLSGGQQQRVSIARALAGNPSVILADEPTGALDSRTGREVLEFLQKLHAEGNTIVLITHDNSIAVKAERIIRLQDGKVVYDGPSNLPEAVVNPDIPLEHQKNTPQSGTSTLFAQTDAETENDGGTQASTDIGHDGATETPAADENDDSVFDPFAGFPTELLGDAANDGDEAEGGAK